METSLSLFELLRSGIKFANNQLIQYQLNTNEKIVIDTKYGKLQGIKRKTVYDEEPYFAFEDVPYGKPPLGDLRFCTSQPAEPWKGVRNCTKWKHRSIQKHFILGIVIGSEDCLYLNIYVKKLKSDKPLPVMVYLHGGAFQIGEATTEVYAPDYFMKEDIILVTVNYRLGAFGFLSLRDPDVGIPGNAGIKDQLLALKWIRNNIAYFNGDPSNITLFGESAGAVSVHLLMLSDKAKGLFHKAILQSGVAENPWAYMQPGDQAFQLAKKLGYKGANNDKAIFAFLSKANGGEIVKACATLLSKEDKLARIWFPFVPVVEPYTSKDCLIIKPFKELQKTAWSNDIPIIIGGATDEGLLSMKDVLKRPYLIDEIGDCQSMLPKDIKQNYTESELNEMGLKLKNAYFGDKTPSTEETLHQFLELSGDYQFWHKIYCTTLARLQYATQAKTYLYRFDFDSPDFNLTRKIVAGENVRGVSHGDDITYLFYNALISILSKDSAEYQTIVRMIGMWTAFAKTGNPNCDAIKPAIWKPIKDETLKCFNINQQLQLIDFPYHEKMKLWNSFYTKESLF